VPSPQGSTLAVAPIAAARALMLRRSTRRSRSRRPRSARLLPRAGQEPGPTTPAAWPDRARSRPERQYRTEARQAPPPAEGTPGRRWITVIGGEPRRPDLECCTANSSPTLCKESRRDMRTKKFVFTLLTVLIAGSFVLSACAPGGAGNTAAGVDVAKGYT